MQVSKWGNSLAVRLPSDVVKALGLAAGDAVEISVVGDRHLQIGRDTGIDQAMARLQALRRPLPKGFKFDREDANAR